MSINITKLLGGGPSWYYAIKDGKILGTAHESDRAGMRRLWDLRKEEA